MVRPEGFEPPTNGFGSHYSIRLSYERVWCCQAAGYPAWHRDPVERDARPAFYPHLLNKSSPRRIPSRCEGRLYPRPHVS